MSKQANHIWVPKGWGGEEILVNNELYCGKILHVMQGKKCSWHYHKIKDETFYIDAGEILLEFWAYGYQYEAYGEVTKLLSDKQLIDRLTGQHWYNLGDKYYGTMARTILKTGDTFHMPVGCPHRFTGLSNINRMFEFSTHDEPSDSYRLVKGD